MDTPTMESTDLRRLLDTVRPRCESVTNCNNLAAAAAIASCGHVTLYCGAHAKHIAATLVPTPGETRVGCRNPEHSRPVAITVEWVAL